MVARSIDAHTVPLPMGESGTSYRGKRPRKPPSAMRFRLTAPVVAEHPLQAQIAKLLTIELAPPGKVSRAGVVWWSVDHANYAGEVPGIRIGRGIIAGIPDVFLLWHGRTFFIEIKTLVGEFSAAQCAVATAVTVAGGRVGVATDAEGVLACLDEWHIPRQRRVRL